MLNHTRPKQVVLTEGAISNLHRENPSKICSFYTDSPLIWGVHTAFNKQFNKTQLQEKAEFAISRYTSGSHLMAFLYLQSIGIKNSPQFNLVNDLNGAREEFKNSPEQLFLWEKFTTKPFVDNKELTKIDEIPTPWPAFVILSSNRIIEKHSDAIYTILKIVQQQAQELKASENSTNEIAARYGLKIEDAQTWFNELKWSSKVEIDTQTLNKVTSTLYDLNLITYKKDAREFIHSFKRQFIL